MTDQSPLKGQLENAGRSSFGDSTVDVQRHVAGNTFEVVIPYFYLYPRYISLSAHSTGPVFHEVR